MIRARFLIGRTLAALAALVIVGILILNVFAFVFGTTAESRNAT